MFNKKIKFIVSIAVMLYLVFCVCLYSTNISDSVNEYFTLFFNEDNQQDIIDSETLTYNYVYNGIDYNADIHFIEDDLLQTRVVNVKKQEGYFKFPNICSIQDSNFYTELQYMHDETQDYTYELNIKKNEYNIDYFIEPKKVFTIKVIRKDCNIHTVTVLCNSELNNCNQIHIKYDTNFITITAKEEIPVYLWINTTQSDLLHPFNEEEIILNSKGLKIDNTDTNKIEITYLGTK